MIGNYNIHPAAELFPLMDDENLKKLSEDIKAHGLQNPIVLCDGKILDGRNRARACELVGVNPKVTFYTGSESPTEYVWSLNATRRHLDKSQLAIIAAKMLPLLEAEAKERQIKLAGTRPTATKSDLTPLGAEGRSYTGESREKAAALVGVGHNYVSQAKKVLNEAPDLAKEVEAGKISLKKAYTENKQRNEPVKEIENPNHFSEVNTDGIKTADDEKQSFGRMYAFQAIQCLEKIPKKDPERAEGFEIVRKWITKYNNK